ncbi:MAG: hypothetical protein J7K95_05540, partial [Thermoplasmata archaeon]|nr:hypothetical protein [Thermoplasmata archaeon]
MTKQLKLDNVISSELTNSFLKAKEEFDKKYGKISFLKRSLVPVNGKIVENIKIRNEKGEKIEEYYKWQFIYSLIYSGLYPK